MDLWSIATYDLRLSSAEFEELTPGMFVALCKRRNIHIRYQQYANAITAAAVYNTNRSKAEDPIVEALDFVRDEKSRAKKERLDKAKNHCRKVMMVPSGTPREKILEIRLRAIKDLEASDYSDAEQIFDSCWPSLKPKKG
jgi:hypothetical protein